MDLLVIGNAQSESVLSNLLEGRTNSGLTDYGKKQAALMSDWVKRNYKVNKIISSPLKQAYQTATYLCERYDIGLSFDNDISDFQNEALSGGATHSLNTDRNSAIRPSEILLNDMENMLQFRMRAENAISRILYENDPESTIAIIGHNRIINMLFQSFLGLPMTCQVSITTSETGIHRWQIKGSARKLIFLNSLVHLEIDTEVNTDNK